MRKRDGSMPLKMKNYLFVNMQYIVSCLDALVVRLQGILILAEEVQGGADAVTSQHVAGIQPAVKDKIDAI